MLRRWLIYAACWLGCVVFFICYLQWFSWLALVAVTLLPLVSLLLSLPAMLTAKVELNFPAAVTMHTQVPVAISLKSPLPLPQWWAKLAVGRELTMESWALQLSDELPTDHCGQLDCAVLHLRVYDYLGLFYRKIKAPAPFCVTVRPVPVEQQHISRLRPAQITRWKAKRGGGFAENYELRLYRPGDNIHQIHWKLSGKTGKLILREALEPSDLPKVKLELSGSPQELDEKLGRLLHQGQELCKQGFSFALEARTGSGDFRRTVTGELALEQAMDALLAQLPLAAEGGGTQ